MSMLSAQCNDLYEAADRFEGYQCGEISRMLREAADTIDSLRDRTHDADMAHSSWPELFGENEADA